jgi:hypothetical protein
MEAQMKNKSDLPGSGNGDRPLEPLEPGRPDVMPNPPDEGDVRSEKDKSHSDTDEAFLEEDMGDVDVNNSVSNENPPQQ